MEGDPDSEAYVRLLAKHEREIYRYLLSLVPSSDADDLMQDTAALLWRKFDEYDADKPFGPWARRFAYFEVLKYRKRMGRSRVVFNDEVVEAMAAEFDEVAPELEARREALDGCLERLGGGDREVLERRYASRLTVAQLADETGESVHRLYYALERIRNSLVACVDKSMRERGFHGA